MGISGYETDLKNLGGFVGVLGSWAPEFLNIPLSKKESYSQKHLIESERLSKLGDEELTQIARKSYEDNLKYHKDEIEEINGKIGLLEKAVEEVDFSLGEAQHPEIIEGLEGFKEFYKERMKEYKEKEIPYETKILSEPKKTNEELLTEKKEEISRNIKYYTKQIKEEIEEIEDSRKKAEEYQRLHVLLKQRNANQKTSSGKVEKK